MVTYMLQIISLSLPSLFLVCFFHIIVFFKQSNLSVFLKFGLCFPHSLMTKQFINFLIQKLFTFFLCIWQFNPFHLEFILEYGVNKSDFIFSCLFAQHHPHKVYPSPKDVFYQTKLPHYVAPGLSIH